MSLAVEQLATVEPVLFATSHPCSGSEIQPEPLVLLHGWGSDSRVWQPLLAELSPHLQIITVDLPGFGQTRAADSLVLDDVLEQLANVLPERFSLLGWSLGGMVATAFASRYPQRVSALITLASNACFTRRKGWVRAMPEPVFNDFYQLFQQNPAQCLKRFHGLQCKGDQREKELLKQLRAGFSPDFSSGDVSALAWQQGLELLATLDNREALQSLDVPGLHIYGDNDALVPVSAAGVVQKLGDRQEALVLERTGHLLPLSDPKKLSDTLLGFLKKSHYRLDKQRVARSFSRAATSYDSVSRLQRQVGHQLLAKLPQQLQPECIVDVGCGTGYFTEFLAEKYPNATVVGLDLAEGMLNFATDARGQAGQWLCADAESLPLASGSVDLVFSSLAFQWCERLPMLASELERVLGDKGVLAFSTLADGTLHELRSAWAAVDNYVHVNQFNQAESWQKAFVDAGMGFDVFQSNAEILHYRDLRHLTNELKGVGAHNINSGQKTRVTNREQLLALISAYEEHRDAQGKLPATWQVIYGLAGKAINE